MKLTALVRIERSSGRIASFVAESSVGSRPSSPNQLVCWLEDGWNINAMVIDGDELWVALGKPL